MQSRCIAEYSLLQEEVTRFYFENAEPTLLRHTPTWQTGVSHTVQIPRLLDFYRAFSMVSSRAFLVDAYHGLAMVPIADAYVWYLLQLTLALTVVYALSFNHVLENHVHLEVRTAKYQPPRTVSHY